jgi:hypothetical protein
MNLKDTIRKVLREENRPLKIMRRTNLIDDILLKLMNDTYKPNKICGYGNSDSFIEVVKYSVGENLYFNTFYEMDDSSKEWEDIFYFISDYIDNKYGEKLINYFHISCGD